MEKKFLKIGEVAKMLSVHPQTIRRWERMGILKSIRTYERSIRRFDVEEILKNLKGRN